MYNLYVIYAIISKSYSRSGDDFDCDTCKSGVMAMGQLLTSDDAANEAVTMLQGMSCLTNLLEIWKFISNMILHFKRIFMFRKSLLSRSRNGA